MNNIFILEYTQYYSTKKYCQIALKKSRTYGGRLRLHYTLTYSIIIVAPNHNRIIFSTIIFVFQITGIIPRGGKASGPAGNTPGGRPTYYSEYYSISRQHKPSIARARYYCNIFIIEYL